MEKFGIFELLDALSAMTALDPSSPAAPATNGEEAAKKPAKRTPDAAFAPPSYADAPTSSSMGSSAYEGFVARHTSATSKVKK